MPSEYRFIMISRGVLNKICRGKENGEPKRRKEQKTLRAKKWYVGGVYYRFNCVPSKYMLKC